MALESKEKKRVLYDRFKDLQQDFKFSKAFKSKFSLKQEGHELVFEDSTRLLLLLHRASQVYGAGEFAAYSNFGVFGGPLHALIVERLPDAKKRYRDDKLVQATSSSLVPNRLHDYEFLSTVDVEGLTDVIINDVRDYLLPLARAFVEDYHRAVEGMLDGSILSRANVRNPFVLTLALLHATKRMDSVERLIATASGNERFYDFHEAGQDGSPSVNDLVRAFTPGS